MGEGPERNPFAPPAEHADFEIAPAAYEHFRLASFSRRFWGSFLDNFLYLIAAAPGGFFVDWKHLDKLEESAGALGVPPSFLPFFVGPLLLASYQWTMTAKTGQTLAKRWLSTRIVREGTGVAPGFVNGVVLRVWLFAFAGLLPGVGNCVGFADAVAIFTGDRRQTLHDRIARTIVIQE